MKNTNTLVTREDGAILVHVAIALLALGAFTAFALDWGVFWVSRNQAQNAADAGALSGAIALAYDDGTDRTDTGPVKQAAFRMTQNNFVWGEAPNVNVTTDVTFPVCPDGNNDCVRVDVYRNQARGNPLPVFFGQLAGLTDQGIRATATAQAGYGNATDCLKPWIIPDKWAEGFPAPPVPYDPMVSTYQTQTCQGNTCTPVATPDVYRRPELPDTTGFRASGPNNDIGMRLSLKAGPPPQQIQGGEMVPGWAYPVRLNEEEPGGDVYRDNIEFCSGDVVRIGDLLRNETGIMVGPTFQGVDALIAADPNAYYLDPDGVGGAPGTIMDSCQNTASCPAPWASSPSTSPRVIALPVFNTATFSQTPGAEWLEVVNILGFFLEQRQGNNIFGYLTHYPGLSATGGGGVTGEAAFSRTVMLIR